MEQTYHIRLIAESESDVMSEFQLEDDGSNCKILCIFDDNTLTSSESDFFEALCQIRHRLEGMGLRPHCYGASLNAYPSAMSRDMSRGLLLYRTELGQPGQRDLMARTFETGDDVVPSSVEEQRMFHRNWFESLSRKKT